MKLKCRSSIMDLHHVKLIVTVFFFSVITVVFSVTDPNDIAIIKEFRGGLKNSELLKWPENGDDPCGPPSWNHIFCTGNRVSQIQVQGMGLKGPLPLNLNKLSRLKNLGLQKNQFSGMLPSLSGLLELRWAYLDLNAFDSIPVDFFDGLTSVEVLALDYNNFNGSAGWSLPDSLQDLTQLTNLTCSGCNLVGPLPDSLGSLSSLRVLRLSKNRLSGGIPASLSGSIMQVLWLNEQSGVGMTGSIHVVTSMVSLTSLWLHGNHFTGTIPENIGDLAGLKDLNLNGNQLVGLVPDSLASMKLDSLDLSNNQLMGPIPKFQATDANYGSNLFCQTVPGSPCAPQVMLLLQFIGGLNYPSRLVSSWSGNDPCEGPWVGLICNTNQKIRIINMPKFGLNGTLSSSVADLDSIEEIRLGTNNITGLIPSIWTSLSSLTVLDLSGNNISPPLPKFGTNVKLVIDGNPLLNGNNQSEVIPSPGNNPPGSETTPTNNPSSPTTESDSNTNIPVKSTNSNSTSKVLIIVAIVACFSVVVCLIVPLCMYCSKKRKNGVQPPSSIVIHPRDPSDSDNMVKVAVANNTNGSISTRTGSGSGSRNSGTGESHVIEAGNLVISVQVLRNVTKNFAPQNELGRGGFGVVYKGDLDDGTKIAVKRMESGVIGNKALDEFQAEIAVLSKVRHRHLVSLLGYSVEGCERILVYEYMSQGALSKHLFHWKSCGLEPLSWKRRLNIALDVARAMEYLHNLAHQSFIHRDLKSSNILLADDFRAKVSDFGLVKLAPNGEKKSVVTRLAGTFGYLAPEYAVTGKITTKVDVFSFGVVLMELLTGLVALDEDRPEETQYLAAWFWNIKSNKEKLMAAIDPSIGVKEETIEAIAIVAELAGHCTAREPSQRPDMSHAVNVLAPLVEKWKPLDDDTEEYSGIDYSLPLTQLVKDWQDSEGKDLSYVDLEDSKSSIPARPIGFAESFNSADGR